MKAVNSHAILKRLCELAPGVECSIRPNDDGCTGYAIATVDKRMRSLFWSAVLAEVDGIPILKTEDRVALEIAMELVP